MKMPIVVLRGARLRRWLGSGIAVAVVAVAAVAAAGAFASGGAIITTFAGTGLNGNSGDGGSATSATFRGPDGVAVDAHGNVYIADYGNSRVRKVAPDGTVSNYAGTGTRGFSGDGGRATSAQLDGPAGLAVDGQGDLYIADARNSRVRKVSPGGTISTFAGGGQALGDGGPATSAILRSPAAVALDGQGNVYIAGGNRVRKVSAGGTITTFAGTGLSGPPTSGNGGPATSANMGPAGVAVDGQGDVYIADYANNLVRVVTPGGVIRTFAGTGTAGSTGDGGPATSAELNYPAGVAIDTQGKVYIYMACEVRQVSGGTITTIAGRSQCGNSGDGGPATSAEIETATALAIDAIAVDAKKNIYIADYSNDRVRRIGPGTQKTAPTTTSRAVRTLAVSFESYLAQMARDRAKLKSVLTSVATCSISPGAAAAQVAAVSAGRQRLLNAVTGFATPTLQAAQIKAALRQSLIYSAAADRAYHDWLAQQGAHCPAAHTPAFGRAQQQDKLATAAKERFVAVFNPLARRLHLRTWSAHMI